MARDIISGDAGTVWQNDTGRAKYQFHCAFINTCGFCLQYHLKISANWPIPLHYKCKCGQTLIEPGEKAPEPFCDYRKLLDEMSQADKAAAIGASNYRLLKTGLATWEDFVTPNRVRDFREVVAKKRLTVKQMVDHGVKRYQAEKAYSAVHTEEHQHVERQRRELLQKLTGAGLSQENLVRELGNRLAARVTIAPGLAGPGGAGPAWGGGPLPGVGPSDAAALAKLISGWRPKRQTAAMPKKPKEKPEPAAPKEKPTFEAAMETAFAEAKRKIKALDLDGMSGIERAGARRAIREEAIIATINDHVVAGPEGAFHGMATPEKFRTVEFWGIRWHFSGQLDAKSAIVRTIDSYHVFEAKKSVPERLLQTTTDVYFTGQSNKNDAHWAKIYKNFDKSAATGGDNRIVVYNNNALHKPMLTHEAGHNLAKDLYGTTHPNGDYGRMLATTKEPPVSDYAKNSPSEDFAEAVSHYIDFQNMPTTHPERYAIIHKIMMDRGYGG